MTLKLRVFLAICIGCIALAAAVVEITILEFSVAKRYVAELKMPSKISAIIHEMQIERGKSVGHIASEFDDSSRPALLTQRKNVDREITNFETYLNRSNSGIYSEDLNASIATLKADLGKLDKMRNGLDDKSAVIPAIVSGYTALIDDMIAVLGHIVQHSKSEVTTSRLIPFLAMVQAKEHGGLERALGSALLTQAAKGDAKNSTFKAYWARRSGEVSALKQFSNVSSFEYKDWFAELIVGEAVEEVSRIREIIAGIMETGDAGGVTGAEYFELATQRLNLFKALEDRIVADFENASTTAYEDQITEAWVLVGLGILALLTSAYLGWSALRGFSSGFRKIQEDVDRLSLGDLSDGAPMGSARDIAYLRQRLGNLRENMRKVVLSGKSMGDGDLKTSINLMSDQDEMGHALEAMRHDLDTVIKDANDMVVAVATGSDQMKNLALEMSAGTQTQAAAAEELRATVSMISDGTRKTLEDTRTMEDISREAAGDAENSGRVVGDAIAAMSTINEQISIVQELARQTDLLALNAAVEAARAGEHGKGFAVVAAEVRKLAERSQDAALQISALSQETSALSEDAGELLGTLVPKIQRCADVIMGITSQMSVQSESISEIEAAIGDLSSEIQTHAIHSGKTAETSEDLAEQAVGLEKLLGRFNTNSAVADRARVADQPVNTATQQDQTFTDDETFDADAFENRKFAA